MVPSPHHSSNQHPSSLLLHHSYAPKHGTILPQPTGSFPSPKAFPAFPIPLNIPLKEKQNFDFEQFNLFGVFRWGWCTVLRHQKPLKLFKILQLKCPIHYDNIEVTFCFNECMSSTQLIIINTAPTNKHYNFRRTWL